MPVFRHMKCSTCASGPDLGKPSAEKQAELLRLGSCRGCQLTFPCLAFSCVGDPDLGSEDLPRVPGSKKSFLQQQNPAAAISLRLPRSSGATSPWAEKAPVPTLRRRCALLAHFSSHSLPDPLLRCGGKRLLGVFSPVSGLS